MTGPASTTSPVKPRHLTPREAEVLMWTACGKTCEEISSFLFLSKETIRSQIKSACRKLDANNKTHAIAIALAHGVLPCGPSPERVITLPSLFGLSRVSPISRPSAARAAHSDPRRLNAPKRRR